MFILLLVRGGGSIEDLWAFNDERVARAIRACPLPIVVGVGHESDVTIADFAADMRAPTPTGAATAAVPEAASLNASVDQLAATMARGWRLRRRVLEQRIDTAWRLIPSPAGQWRAQAVRVEQASMRMNRAMAGLDQARRARLHASAGALRVPDFRLPATRLNHLAQRLSKSADQLSKVRESALDALQAQLTLVSPQAVLERGYSIVRDENGHVVTTVNATQPGQSLDVLMSDGELAVTVQPASND